MNSINVNIHSLNLKILKNKSPAQAYIVNPKPTKPTYKQNETNLKKKKTFYEIWKPLCTLVCILTVGSKTARCIS